MNRSDRSLFVYLHEATQKKPLLYKTQVFLFVILDLSPSSLSIFVSHRHTLPASQWEEAAGKSPEWYRETLGDGRPVIIYLHGQAGTRWDEK